MGIKGCFLVGKAAYQLTRHLHLVPRSRMLGAIPSLPQYAFMAWCSVKRTHRYNFTFTHVTSNMTVAGICEVEAS
jgi:hypothetical protein